MPEGTPTLLVGVGGFAHVFLRNCAARFEPEGLVLRSIDTCGQDLDQADPLLPQRAVTNLGGFDPHQVLRRPGVIERSGIGAASQDELASWDEVDAGTRGIRLLGRLAFVNGEAMLHANLAEDAARLAQEPGSESRALALVIAGLSGGTGSSFLAELGWIVRRAMATRLAGDRIRVFGVLLLPSLTDLLVPNADAGDGAQRIANTRAALDELSAWKAGAPPHRLLSEPPPRDALAFDALYLLGGEPSTASRTAALSDALDGLGQLVALFREAAAATILEQCGARSKSFTGVDHRWLTLPRRGIEARFSNVLGSAVREMNRYAGQEWLDLPTILANRLELVPIARALELIDAKEPRSLSFALDVPERLPDAGEDRARELDQFRRDVRATIPRIPDTEASCRFLSGLVNEILLHPGFRIPAARRTLLQLDGALERVSNVASTPLALEQGQVAREVLDTIRAAIAETLVEDVGRLREWVKFVLHAIAFVTENVDLAAREAAARRPQPEHVQRWLLPAEALTALTTGQEEAVRVEIDRRTGRIVARAVLEFLEQGTHDAAAFRNALLAAGASGAVDAIAKRLTRPEGSVVRLIDLASPARAVPWLARVDLKADDASANTVLVRTGLLADGSDAEKRAVHDWASRPEAQARIVVQAGADALRDDVVRLVPDVVTADVAELRRAAGSRTRELEAAVARRAGLL